MKKLRLRELKEKKKNIAKIWNMKDFSETKAHPLICCKTQWLLYRLLGTGALEKNQRVSKLEDNGKDDQTILMWQECNQDVCKVQRGWEQPSEWNPLGLPLNENEASRDAFCGHTWYSFRAVPLEGGHAPPFKHPHHFPWTGLINKDTVFPDNVHCKLYNPYPF